MKSCFSYKLIFGFVCLFISPLILADPSSDLSSRMALWRSHSQDATCKDDVTQFVFPAKHNPDGSKCDDGDATLFNALLCYSGESIGCDAVDRAQVKQPSLPAKGEWKRSPRYASNTGLRTSNSFSPDMALGVHLYTTIRRKEPQVIQAYIDWLTWIEANRPCILTIVGDLCVHGLPRFCRDDDEKGCTLRPGDLAMLRTVLARLGVNPPNPLPPLSDDLLKLIKVSPKELEQLNELSLDRISKPFLEWSIPVLLADSVFNRAGFSQHLVGVGILIMRQFPPNFDEPILDQAAKNLAQKQPKNPFFSYLAAEPKDVVTKKLLAACPETESNIPTIKSQWIWERADDDPSNPKEHTMLWDCIFMGNLIQKMP